MKHLVIALCILLPCWVPTYAYDLTLKDAMEERGVTVRGLAEKTGLDLETIMRARGDLIGRCTLDTLATIATALGAKAKDLFSED